MGVGSARGTVPVAPSLTSSGSDSEAASRALQAALEGDALSAQGRFADARARYAESLHWQPEEGKYHLLSAICEWSEGLRDSAGDSLRTAVRLSPELPFGHEALGQWYLFQGMADEALEASGRAMALAPQNVGIASSRAWALEAAGQLEEAWDLIQRVVAAGHVPPTVVMLYGRMARRGGKQAEALDLVMRALGAGSVAATDESLLRFTAAELLDGMGRYDEAFAHATRGNALRRIPYDAQERERTFERIISYCRRRRMICLPKASYRSDKPVFIVGMPRSGTTLVEQILASHPSVHGAGELDFMSRVVAGTLDMLHASEADYPEFLDGLSLDKADGMAQIYLEPLIALNPAAARITDKMPLNFVHLGLIALLLPDARVIHCRRNPLDTCLSCYMTSFSNGNDFKYNLSNLGKFYRQYERLMAHWKQVLDLPILDVSYEAVTADPEAQSRRMIEFLGLPWDDRCLKFHETRRPIATASVEQVRRPIYRSSVQRWRNYEKYLGPLKAELARD